VRRLRGDLGMSLRELARSTGLSPSFLSQVENGLVSPSARSMERIAESLALRLDELSSKAP